LKWDGQKHIHHEDHEGHEEDHKALRDFSLVVLVAFVVQVFHPPQR
jgi:hypothetical protein